MEEGSEEEGELAARHLAHDLLQSIAIIRVTLDAHRRVNPGVESVFSTIEREFAVMASLCDQELHGTHHIALIDPGAIAQNVIVRMQSAYSGELLFDMDGLERKGTSQRIRGNAIEWERALLNLVENGCRAAGPTGKVLVLCGRTNETLTISVSDSGPGFGQASAGRSSLGMVAVMRLVEHHGGHLELRRGELGGALLTVVLPLVAIP